MMTRAAFFLALASMIACPAHAKDSPPTPNSKGEAELVKLLDGRVQGTPERCITASASSSDDNARIVEGTAIVYGSGRTLYVNRPRGNLDTLREGNTLVAEVWGSQHCALDRVHTVEPGSGFPHSILMLGEFTPYTKPRK